jgi:hypothetical protein
LPKQISWLKAVSLNPRSVWASAVLAGSKREARLRTG